VIPLSPRLIRIVELEEPVVTKKMLKPIFEEDTLIYKINWIKPFSLIERRRSFNNHHILLIQKIINNTILCMCVQYSVII